MKNQKGFTTYVYLTYNRSSGIYYEVMFDGEYYYPGDYSYVIDDFGNLVETWR